MRSVARAALISLIPLAAWASPRPNVRHIAALLIPMDRSAEAETPKLETYMEAELSAIPNLMVRKRADLFGMPGNSKAQTSLKRAETGYRESRAAYAHGSWSDAEPKLHSTILEYGKAAAAMKGCGHLCDAIAMYAAVLHHRGDIDDARLAVLDLLSLDPAFDLSPKRFTRAFIAYRAKVATSVDAQLRGSVHLDTRPPGASIYLDGSFVGYSPMDLPLSAAGKHLIRVERPGFQRAGEIIYVSPEAQTLSITLKPTATMKTYDGLTDGLAQELVHPSNGQLLTRLGQTLGLDEAILGTANHRKDSDETVLRLGLFDLRTGKELARRRVSFQGNEYGQLKESMGRVVEGLVHAASGPKVSRKSSSDPLDAKSGMEHWDESDSSASSEKKSRGDPLDSKTGMEDW